MNDEKTESLAGLATAMKLVLKTNKKLENRNFSEQYFEINFGS